MDELIRGGKGWINLWMNERRQGWMNLRMNEWINEWMNGWEEARIKISEQWKQIDDCQIIFDGILGQAFFYC